MATTVEATMSLQGTGLAFFLDDDLVAVPLLSCIDIWSISTKQILRKLGHYPQYYNTITSMCFHSPSGLLVDGCINGNLRFWNTTTATLQGQRGSYNSSIFFVSFINTKENRQFLLSVQASALLVTNTVTLDQTRLLYFAVDASVACVFMECVSMDLLCVGFSDGEIRVYSFWASRAEDRIQTIFIANLHYLKDHSTVIQDLAIDSNEQLYSLSKDKINVWSVGKGNILHTLALDTSLTPYELLCGRLFCDGQANVIFICRGKTLELWNRNDNRARPISLILFNQPLAHIDLSPNKRYFLSSSEGAHTVWKIKEDTEELFGDMKNAANTNT